MPKKTLPCSRGTADRAARPNPDITNCMTEAFQKLVELVETLRGPQGCPWDREQTRETLKPMLIEEAYEVLEALDDPDPRQLCDELGDLLFQVLFHAQISHERGEFQIDDVVTGIHDKMVRRHPHVFGQVHLETSEDVLKNWEELKKNERRQRGLLAPEKQSLLSGVPAGLPALHECFQLSAKAARVGFDWPDLTSLLDKLAEEARELREVAGSNEFAAVREEAGDLLFAAVNAARFLQIDPETALKQANRKFSRRFQSMESRMERDGLPLKDSDMDTLEKYWQEAKSEERSSG